MRKKFLDKDEGEFYMKKRKYLLLIKVLMMALIVVALSTSCEKQQTVNDNKKFESITLLEYYYGSYFGGDYNLSLFYENEIPYITAKGMNGVELSFKQEITKEKVASLEAALKQHEVATIDGFHERDSDIMDGYGFSLDIKYSAENLSSSGYMKYPENYSEIHEVLTDFFFDIIESSTTFDRNEPFEKSTAYDEFAFLGVPTTNSCVTYFSYSINILEKGRLDFIYDSEKKEQFDVSYCSWTEENENKEVVIQTKEIDTTISLEDLSKLEERLREYELFSYSGYYDVNSINGDTDSTLRTEIRVLYEDGTDINIQYNDKMNDRLSGWEDDFMKEIEELFGATITDYIGSISNEK
jgi:hypothetical protein